MSTVGNRRKSNIMSLNAEYVAILFIIGMSSCCLELECSKFINCEHKLFSTLEFYREMVAASSSVADKCFTWFCERGLGWSSIDMFYKGDKNWATCLTDQIHKHVFSCSNTAFVIVHSPYIMKQDHNNSWKIFHWISWEFYDPIKLFIQVIRKFKLSCQSTIPRSELQFHFWCDKCSRPTS